MRREQAVAGDDRLLSDGRPAAEPEAAADEAPVDEAPAAAAEAVTETEDAPAEEAVSETEDAPAEEAVATEVETEAPADDAGADDTEAAAASDETEAPADEADVNVTLSLTDVRKRSDLSDYTGQLQVDSLVRITDSDNEVATGGGSDPATVTDFPLAVPATCAATPDTSIGGDCSVSTTLDALVPSTVKEGDRASWQLGAVQVSDGGAEMGTNRYVPRGGEIAQIAEQIAAHRIDGLLMAGGWSGYEAAHVDVSLAMAELSLLPAVRKADPETLVVADGTSCRHQIADGAGREAIHVIRVLELALDQGVVQNATASGP